MQLFSKSPALPLTAAALLFILGCGGSKATAERGASPELISRNSVEYRAAMDHYLNGLSAEAKEDFSGAILEFQEAAAEYPTAAIYFSLGKNYAQLGRLPPALHNARIAYRMDSTNADYGYLLHDIYSSARLSDSAMLTMEKVIRQDSSQLEAYFKLARLYENSKPAQAIVLYKMILKKAGFEWTILQRLAELSERVGDIKGCITSLEELALSDPDNLNLQLLIIEMYERDGNNEQVAKKLDELSAFYPDNLSVLETKAKLMIKQDKLEEAARYYLRAFQNADVALLDKIRIAQMFLYAGVKDSTVLPYVYEMLIDTDKDTSDWEVKLYLGAAAMGLRNDSVAIAYLHQAVELAPYNSEGWLRLGGLYFDNGKYKEAVTVLTQAVDKFPEEFGIHLILGLSHSQLGEYSLAEPFLEKAVRLNKQDLNALASYGYTLHKLAKSNDAIKYMNQALLLDPVNVNIMSTLGLIFDELEMWTECDSIYLAALVVDSANALIKNNYAYSLSKRAVELPRALRMVTEALEKEPANSSYLDTKGWVYYQMGEFRNAKDFIERSLAINGDNAVVLDHLGDVFDKMGDNKKAIETWRKAVELKPADAAIKAKIERRTK